MGIKAAIGALVWAISIMDAQASDYLQDLNNYSHQSIICATYYTITAQCLRNRADQESNLLAGRYDLLAKQAIEESYQTAKIAGLSDKAAIARSEIEAQGQMDDIENSCINISVLNLKHGKLCKSFMETRGKTLDAIVAKMKSDRGQ